MGYRLDVVGKKTKKNYYGSKLYGYESNEVLKSFKYLVNKGKFDGSEYFGYCSDNEIMLNKNEFKRFIKLYNEDLNDNYYKGTKDENWFIGQEEIQELLNTDEDKIISWG